MSFSIGAWLPWLLPVILLPAAGFIGWHVYMVVSPAFASPVQLYQIPDDKVKLSLTFSVDDEGTGQCKGKITVLGNYQVVEGGTDKIVCSVGGKSLAIKISADEPYAYNPSTGRAEFKVNSAQATVKESEQIEVGMTRSGKIGTVLQGTVPQLPSQINPPAGTKLDRGKPFSIEVSPVEESLISFAVQTEYKAGKFIESQRTQAALSGDATQLTARFSEDAIPKGGESAKIYVHVTRSNLSKNTSSDRHQPNLDLVIERTALVYSCPADSVEQSEKSK